MQLCAIDPGYWATKMMFKERKWSFKSRYQETNELKGLDIDVIKYEGTNYIVGEGKSNLSENKTGKLLHKLCILKGLGEVTDNAEEYNIITTLPMIHFKNKEYREEFKEYISKPPFNKIHLNGCEKNITIRRHEIAMQGHAALYAYNPSQYKHKLMAVFDMGGGTVDCCIIENLVPIPETIFTLKAGVTVLYSRLKTVLNERFLLNIQDYQVPYISKDGLNILGDEKKEAKKVIQKVIDEHFEEVLEEMRRKNYSIETLQFLGLGGGSLKLKDTIKRYLPQFRTSQDSIYDTVIGSYNIGRMIFNV